MSLGNTVLQLFFVIIHGAYIVSFNVESIVILRKYFLKYECSAQYGCFLYFLDFTFSWYVAHVFSELL